MSTSYLWLKFTVRVPTVACSVATHRKGAETCTVFPVILLSGGSGTYFGTASSVLSLEGNGLNLKIDRAKKTLIPKSMESPSIVLLSGFISTPLTFGIRSFTG